MMFKCPRSEKQLITGVGLVLGQDRVEIYLESGDLIKLKLNQFKADILRIMTGQTLSFDKTFEPVEVVLSFADGKLIGINSLRLDDKDLIDEFELIRGETNVR